LIRALLDMLRLRSGPQDLPAATGLAFLLAIFYALQGIITDRALDGTDTAPRSLLAIAVQLGAISALLRARRQAARIPQTISALAGTGFIFGALAYALLSQAQPGEPQPGLATAYLGLFVWSLAVDAHIYRHALSIKMSLGVLVAVLIFGANFIILKAVFG
jgi:peptidoglycan/LPS O-acetylase OafA/YrhL